MEKRENILLSILLFMLIIGAISFHHYAYLPIEEFGELNTKNIIIEDDTVNLSSLTLEQKIAQMIMVRGDEKDLDFNRLNVGGIFLDRQNASHEYKRLIEDYQEDSKIKLLVASDLEGAWTPFHNPKPEEIFPNLSEIKNISQAREVGLKEGELLSDIGFNINFAPVAEYSDNAYGGRAFSGAKEQVAVKIAAYIEGLQTNILGTCKHYPGKGMEKNLHEVTDSENISKEDLYLFNICLKENISSIMIGHQIASGEVINSNGKPSSVSEEVISSINNSVLIISDEINMQGLSSFYSDKTEMYADLINSGENIILDFDINSFELYKLIKNIKREVKEGDIDEQKIDNSVKKILERKGYNVI
jgi:beta-N-acetylhexosaminidase